MSRVQYSKWVYLVYFEYVKLDFDTSSWTLMRQNEIEDAWGVEGLCLGKNDHKWPL